MAFITKGMKLPVRECICQDCGQTYLGKRNALCPECKRKHELVNKGVYEQSRAASKEKRGDSNRRISQIVAEASAMGLSYGKYVALMRERSIK